MSAEITLPATTPESYLETPVFVNPDAIVWEAFDGDQIAITALVCDAKGAVTQYYRTEWACFILGAKVNEFDLAEDQTEPAELPSEVYLQGGMTEIDQPEAPEGYWAETENLQWQSAKAGRQPPFIALLVRVRTDDGETTLPLRDWHSGLSPEQQKNFNLYQLYR